MYIPHLIPRRYSQEDLPIDSALSLDTVDYGNGYAIGGNEFLAQHDTTLFQALWNGNEGHGIPDRSNSLMLWRMRTHQAAASYTIAKTLSDSFSSVPDPAVSILVNPHRAVLIPEAGAPFSVLVTDRLDDESTLVNDKKVIDSVVRRCSMVIGEASARAFIDRGAIYESGEETFTLGRVAGSTLGERRIHSLLDRAQQVPRHMAL